MATAANALVIMTKAPMAGQVKTRLVPPLDYEQAAALAEALLLDQIDNLAKFTDASLYINYTPAFAYFEKFTAHGFSLFEQQGDDLGLRMRHAFERLFALGHRRIILIGSDLPAFPHATLTRVFDSLSRGMEVVLCPTDDGGYCLVAMQCPVFDIFEGITWSRNDVLARSIQRLATLGARYELLKTSYDIDTWDDVRRLHSACENGQLAMSNTVALLRRLSAKGLL
ncbi:MAG: glycosyltransferase [Deltaproteobacteria bacterium]|nr:glycosyltransferase [Deltaproteobacteria bacterium]MBM4298783.1 glycosyltransferase [Deltaproteobacteria bacterium]